MVMGSKKIDAYLVVYLLQFPKKQLHWSAFEFFLFVIKGFLTDYKLLFDTEFKYENRFAQSTLVFFYSTFNLLNKYEKYFK